MDTVRPTDQKLTAIEKLVFYSQLPREGGTSHHMRPLREAPEWIRSQRERKEHIARVCVVVSAEAMGKAGYAGFELASLNNFGRLWAVGAVLSCLVPGPGVISVGEYWPGA